MAEDRAAALAEDPRRRRGGGRRRPDHRAVHDQYADAQTPQATIDQIRQLEEAGADIVRVSCPDEDSTAAFARIAREVNVPLVADIHFHYRRAIEAAAAGAACLRINPGNIGSAARVSEVVQAAKDHGCSMRIGVNAGSLENHLLEKYGEPCPAAMVESALAHAAMLEDHDFREYKISVKASDVFLTVAAYQALCGGHRRAAALGRHRSRLAADRRGEVVDRAGLAIVGGHR